MLLLLELRNVWFSFSTHNSDYTATPSVANTAFWLYNSELVIIRRISRLSIIARMVSKYLFINKLCSQENTVFYVRSYTAAAYVINPPVSLDLWHPTLAVNYTCAFFNIVTIT